MVALFNGSGGAASLLVGWATLYGGDVSSFTAFTILLAILIGGVTLTGSLVAYGKLSETINSAAVVFTGQRIVNSLVLVGILVAAISFVSNRARTTSGSITLALALLLGIMVVIPIGGADMPVVTLLIVIPE